MSQTPRDTISRAEHQARVVELLSYANDQVTKRRALAAALRALLPLLPAARRAEIETLLEIHNCSPAYPVSDFRG